MMLVKKFLGFSSLKEVLSNNFRFVFERRCFLENKSGEKYVLNNVILKHYKNEEILVEIEVFIELYSAIFSSDGFNVEETFLQEPILKKYVCYDTICETNNFQNFEQKFKDKAELFLKELENMGLNIDESRELKCVKI